MRKYTIRAASARDDLGEIRREFNLTDAQVDWLARLIANPEFNPNGWYTPHQLSGVCWMSRVQYQCRKLKDKEFFQSRLNPEYSGRADLIRLSAKTLEDWQEYRLADAIEVER